MRSLEIGHAEEQAEVGEKREAMRAEILRLKGEIVEKFREAEAGVRLKLASNEWLTGVTMITKRADDPKTGQKLALRENWNFMESQHPFSGPDSSDLKLEREYGAATVRKFGGSRISRNLERLVLNGQGVFFSQEDVEGAETFSKAGSEPQTEILNPELLIGVLEKFARCLKNKEFNFAVTREMSDEPRQPEAVKPMRAVGVGVTETKEVTSLPQQPSVLQRKSIHDEPTIKG